MIKPVSDAVATRAAKQVWEYVYPEPWPEDWVVRWQDLPSNRLGDCNLHGKLIRLGWVLKYKEEEEVINTLIHEFTHLRHPDLLHSEGFTRRVHGAYCQLNGSSLVDDYNRVRAENAQAKWALRRMNRQVKELATLTGDMALDVWWTVWQVRIAI
jgi:hypothetical protein